MTTDDRPHVLRNALAHLLELIDIDKASVKLEQFVDWLVARLRDSAHQERSRKLLPVEPLPA